MSRIWTWSRLPVASLRYRAMKGTVPPSFSRPITATSDCMERFSVFAMCRSISGERVFASAMFAVSILAAMRLENGCHISQCRLGKEQGNRAQPPSCCLAQALWQDDAAWLNRHVAVLALALQQRDRRH